MVGDLVAYRPDGEEILCVWKVEELCSALFGPAARLSFFGGYTIMPGHKREGVWMSVADLKRLDLTPLEILAWASLNPFDD